jgi:AAA domain
MMPLVYSLAELHDATRRKYPHAFDVAKVKAREPDSDDAPHDEGDFDWRRPATTPKVAIDPEYFARRLSGIGDRSAIAATVIECCRRSGWTPEETFAALMEHEDAPVMDHYDGSSERVREDIERLWTKLPPDDKGGSETFAGAATAASDVLQDDGLIARFRGFWPDEYEALPDLEFWDDDKTLPQYPDGAIVVLYGWFGSHKTNTVLAMLIEAALGRGARVVYAAGEGAHGVGKQRIPAHCRTRGITTRDLRGKLRLVPAVPLFASGEQVEAFIRAQDDIEPNIVALDTLATAIAGEDENGSKASSYLTSNGPAGKIRDRFRALVIVLAHPGKDEDKGIRGHSGFGGNVDAILHLKAQDCGAIELHVEKMRDGRDGFSIYFKVPPKGSPEVPVPVRITEAEYKALAVAGGTDDDSQEGRCIGILRERGCYGWAHGLEDEVMAEAVVEFLTNSRQPADSEVDALAEWRTAVAKEKKSLQQAAGKRQWAKRLTGSQVLPGGKVLVRRWFLPQTGQPVAPPQY